MQVELQVVGEVIRGAGEIVLKHYEAGAQADDYRDGEPVTVADRESDAYIVAALQRAFPDDEIVSEESSDALVGAGRGAAFGAAGGDAAFQLEHTPDAEPPSVNHAPPRVWYIDPLDGTSDFVRRTDEFVVMIGLAIAGWPVLGAVYHPPTATLYRGGHGIVAEKIIGDAPPVAMRVSDIAEPTAARLVVSRSHTPESVAEVADKLGVEKMDKCGSVGLKAARIAAGAGDLYLHPSPGTKLWDTCAAEAILVAAGGSFSDCDGKPLVYDPRDLHNRRGILASNSLLHDTAAGCLDGLW